MAPAFGDGRTAMKTATPVAMAAAGPLHATAGTRRPASSFFASSASTRSPDGGGASPPRSRVHRTLRNTSATSAARSPVSSMTTGTRKGVPRAMIGARSAARRHARRTQPSRRRWVFCERIGRNSARPWIGCLIVAVQVSPRRSPLSSNPISMPWAQSVSAMRRAAAASSCESLPKRVRGGAEGWLPGVRREWPALENRPAARRPAPHPNAGLPWCSAVAHLPGASPHR